MPNLFGTILTTSLTIQTYLICTLVSLLLGCVIAFAGTRKTKCSQTMLITIIVLPAIVQTVIMLVNGNVGTGVAVAGAFSLVRFRSLPGNAKDIAVIFLAMAVGIATGTGYLGIAAVFTMIVSIVFVAILYLNLGGSSEAEKDLKITIPESLDYSEVFEDVFSEYTNTCQLQEVKTSNMGSLYKLHYVIELKADKLEKEMIDQLRCRNGNLEISCGRCVTMTQTL